MDINTKKRETDKNNSPTTNTRLFCFCGKCDLYALNISGGARVDGGPLTSCFLRFSQPSSPQEEENTIMAPKEDSDTTKTGPTDDKPSLGQVPRTPLADFKFPEKNASTKDDDDDKNHEKEGCDNAASYDSKTPLPLISLRQGLNKKATPWALSSWVKLALTLDGRDKITKVCQYSARMLAWWFAANVNQMKRFKGVQASITTSRKAFRLGRSFIEIQKIRDSGFLDLLFFGGSNNNNSKTTTTTTSSSDPAWKIIGSTMKMIGLMGFWAGDNINFLTGSGLFDDYRISDPRDRLAKRNQLKTQASIFANRFYFFGAVAGLLTGLKAYLSYRSGALREAHERLADATKRVAAPTAAAGADRTEDEETRNNQKQLWKEAKEAMEKAKEKQFSLFLALLKSCVDVMVFSNNPGIDLHKRFRGKKNHEGFHCLCGLTSAATVLYNNYPNATK